MDDYIHRDDAVKTLSENDWIDVEDIVYFIENNITSMEDVRLIEKSCKKIADARIKENVEKTLGVKGI